jgi:hypothetical protein
MNVNDFNKKFSVKGGKVVPKAKSSKFKNTKVELDGHKFDSIKESKYYSDLKIKKASRLIKDFKMQVKFDINVNNIHIANYFLDFLIEHNDGTFEYIDIKGKDSKSNKFIKTSVFALKKKLVEAIYQIKISMA